MHSKIVILFIIIIASFSSVNGLSIVQQPGLPDPGITPDSPFYGLDLLFDELKIMLTTSPIGKAQVSIQIANERLSEFRAMTLSNKQEHAQTAKTQQLMALGRVTESVPQISSNNPLQEVEEEIIVETQIERHQVLVENIEQEVQVTASTPGNTLIPHQVKISKDLNEIKTTITDVRNHIDTQKKETKKKIATTLKINEEEVERQVVTIKETFFEPLPKLVLHRTVKNCEDDSPITIQGVTEQIFPAGGSTRYYNFACENRKIGQCYEDGTFDTYYDEFCDDTGTELYIIITFYEEDSEISIHKNDIDLDFSLPTNNLQKILTEIHNRTLLSMEEIENHYETKIRKRSFSSG